MCDRCGWQTYHRDLRKLLDFVERPRNMSSRIEHELEHLADSLEANKHMTPAQKYSIDEIVRRARL